MASIVNFSKMRRVAVFLPYNKEVNSEKKAIADILRAEGISDIEKIGLAYHKNRVEICR